MKRFLAVLLSAAMLLTGCASQSVIKDDSTTDWSKSVISIDNTEAEEIDSQEIEHLEKDDTSEPLIPEDETGDDVPYTYEPVFNDLSDEELLTYVKDSVYKNLVENLDSPDYFVENVSAVYVSQDYLEEASYNSKSNIFFGYTLDEIEKIYPDSQYVFTLGDDGKTTVQPFENYDDTYEKVIKNVAIGTGVILVCVTVSVVTGGAGAPAISMIFAASAKTGTIVALSSGAISAAASGIVTGVQTGDMQQALKMAALSGSDSFKWGAISGAISGGAGETLALKGATRNGLSMNEAAEIQKESHYPIDIIKQFHSKKEYEVFKEIGLKSQMVDGKLALVRNDIDLNAVDEYGRSNFERMTKGLSPIDSNGNSFELHHIGQNADGSLAILTQQEHDNAVLHGFKNISEIDRTTFAKQRKQFWKTMAQLLKEGAV